MNKKIFFKQQHDQVVIVLMTMTVVGWLVWQAFVQQFFRIFHATSSASPRPPQPSLLCTRMDYIQ